MAAIVETNITKRPHFHNDFPWRSIILLKDSQLQNLQITINISSNLGEKNLGESRN